MWHPFEVGDIVQCVTDQYVGLKRGWTRRVIDVREKGGTKIIVLKNRFSPYFDENGVRTSEYSATNFVLVSRPKRSTLKMGYERTKFFAVRLDRTQNEGSEADGLCFDGFPDGFTSTAPRDTRHEVRVDVGKLVKEGERWLVCQTVMLIEGEEPRPPMKITEYK